MKRKGREAARNALTTSDLPGTFLTALGGKVTVMEVFVGNWDERERGVEAKRENDKIMNLIQLFHNFKTYGMGSIYIYIYIYIYI
jgi:hypothetical protein